jgi:hypothetical protein
MSQSKIKVTLRGYDGTPREIDATETAFIELANEAGELLQVIALRGDGSIGIMDSESPAACTYTRWFGSVFTKVKEWVGPR